MRFILLTALMGLAASAKLPSSSYEALSIGHGHGGVDGHYSNGIDLNGSNFIGGDNEHGDSTSSADNHNGVTANEYNNGVENVIVDVAINIPGGGVPGEDYPILASVPETGFSCDEQAVPGYYADTAPEAGCQVFHICQERPNGRQQDSFLCPNGTIFNQQYLVCDWWFNFDCADAESFYSVNELIGVDSNAANGYGDKTDNGNGSNGNGSGANGYSSNTSSQNVNNGDNLSSIGNVGTSDNNVETANSNEFTSQNNESVYRPPQEQTSITGHVGVIPGNQGTIDADINGQNNVNTNIDDINTTNGNEVPAIPSGFYGVPV